MSLKKFLIQNSQFLILLVAVLLRLWKLDVIPPHLTPDEAALGYNAYSILKTGSDEHGQFLPVVFKSFGDYKPGLYVYLTVPFVAVFGLTEWSVRLPGALGGVLAVWLIYFIVKKFGETGFTHLEKQVQTDKLALASSFLLAINPWHIHFSRGAWEANISLTLTLLGIYFFLKAFKNSNFLLLSSVFFSLTFLAYQGAKLSTSIVLLILVITFWKEMKSLLLSGTVLASSIFVGLVVSFPILLSVISGQTGRLNVFSVFSYPRPQGYLQTFLDQGEERVGGLNYYLFHSETLNFSRGVMGRWFNHFSGRFLFFEGDYQNPRHSSPNHGMLLLSDLLFLIVGGVVFLKTKEKRLRKFIILWLILAPLPAVLSRDQVHAIRALNMVFPLTLLSATGFTYLFERRSKTIKAFLLIIFSVSLIYYLDSYFIHLSKHNSKYWDYGFKQIVEVVTPIQKNYKEIKIQQSFAQPYIYFLFYQKYDPASYQKQANFTESEFKGDVGYVTNLDNISFTGIDWSVNRGDHNTLIIADPIRIPDADSSDQKLFNKISEIKYLNGETAFKIIEIK